MNAKHHCTSVTLLNNILVSLTDVFFNERYLRFFILDKILISLTDVSSRERISIFVSFDRGLGHPLTYKLNGFNVYKLRGVPLL